MKFLNLTQVYLLILIPSMFVVFEYAFGEPTVLDSDYKVEQFVTGLSDPVHMEFVDTDILVIQKNDGKIIHILNDGTILPDPVLDVEVASKSAEAGLLGIVFKNNFVYLYYTEATVDGGDAIGNNVYKYKWINSKLKDPILLKELPAAWVHNSGVLRIDKEGTVYAVIGEQGKNFLRKIWSTSKFS